MNDIDAPHKVKPKANVQEIIRTALVMGFAVFCIVIVALFDRAIVSLITSSNNVSKVAASSVVNKNSKAYKSLVSNVKASPISSPSSIPAVAPVVPSPKSSVYKLTLTSSKVSSGAVASYDSSNWAGYMATKGNFTGITASWGVPEALGSYRATSGDGTWIGIGGITSSDLIQIGTQNTVSSSGQVSTTGFYEILPAGPQLIDSVSILPGSPVTASIDETQPGLWKATLTNQANGQNFTIYLLYNSSGSSGEWIEEDPTTSPGQFEALDDFGRVSFTAGSATVNGATTDISGSGALPISMVNQSKAVLAKPSDVQIGTNFDVNWQ